MANYGRDGMIEVFDGTGALVALLASNSDGLREAWIDSALNGICALTFELPLTSEKWQYLTDDCQLIAGQRAFVLSVPDATDEVRDGRKLWGKVRAEEAWTELRRRYATVSNDPSVPAPAWGSVIIISGGVASGGFAPGSAGSALSYLLQGTGWTVDTVDVSGTFDLETERLSVLANITEVQRKWGGYLVWDSVAKTVSLRSETLWARDTGFHVRYAKNLKSITRTLDNDLVTRLYPFGADGLTIASVNGGAMYLDDHSYSARVIEGTWENQDISDPATLKAKAAEQLAKMCRPRAYYRIGMVDLRSLPAYSHEVFQIGDIVTVFDPDITPNGASVRVIRHKYNLVQPQKCELEVGDQLEKLEQVLANSAAAASYLDTKIRPNGRLSGFLRGLIDTFATRIKSASGKLHWNDDRLEAIETDQTGAETGRRVVLSPGGLGVSKDGGQTFATAITGDGVLADRVIINELFALATADGYTKVAADGLKVMDEAEKQRVAVGWWMDGIIKRFGLKVWGSDGSTVMLDDQGILQTWQEGRADNIDNGHPLVLNIYLPPETKSVHKALLRLRLQKFRAYETGASAGGSVSTTSGSGGGESATSSSGGSSTPTSGVGSWSSGGSLPVDFMSSPGDHNHGVASGTVLLKSGGGTVTFVASGNHSHSLYAAHTHTIAIPNHQHTVTIGSHAHSVSIPDHTHSIVYGIYEGDQASGVSVSINGIDRTAILGGPFISDQSDLSISTYLVTGQWNVISLGSAAKGRIDASVFIQARMGV